LSQLRANRKPRVYGVVVGLLLLSSVKLAKGQTRQPFSLEISTAQDQFKIGAEIKVQIKLMNVSDQNILIHRSLNPSHSEESGFLMDVRDGEGKSAVETETQRVLRGEVSEVFITSGGAGWLPPGQSEPYFMIVGDFFDLTKPGEYKIQVQRIDPVSKVLVKSNVIAVALKP
jgi:hypothetical protein